MEHALQSQAFGGEGAGGLDGAGAIPKELYLSAQGCEARATLGTGINQSINPNGCSNEGRDNRCNPLGVDGQIAGQPRVARPSQPWALRWNPFGIRWVAIMLWGPASASEAGRFSTLDQSPPGSGRPPVSAFCFVPVEQRALGLLLAGRDSIRRRTSLCVSSEHLLGLATPSTDPGAFPVRRFAQDVQDQRYVPLDLEIEHADTNEIGPILEGIGEA